MADIPIPDILKCPTCGEELLLSSDGKRLLCINMDSKSIVVGPIHAAVMTNLKAMRGQQDRLDAQRVKYAGFPEATKAGVRFVRLTVYRCFSNTWVPRNDWRTCYTIAGRDGLWRQTTTSIGQAGSGQVAAWIAGRGRLVFEQAVEVNAVKAGGE